MIDTEAPVLIAGGGLVGLSAATFLAQHGVRSVTIDRLRVSSPLPRAAFFHMRTLEMFRSVGIEDRVNQPSLEPILRERAREAGATVIQGAEITAVSQDAGGVSVTMKDVTSGGVQATSAAGVRTPVLRSNSRFCRSPSSAVPAL